MMALSILGLVVTASVWAIGLLFGLPLWIPIGITLVIANALAARFAWIRYRGAQAERQIERSLLGQSDQLEQRARPDQRAEIRALSSQFEAALQTLKSSKLASGRGGALYALPWYAIIGPPGAGKSTALRNSGLKFPLSSAQASVRGIGGTRNCDWWLTNEAVLLDTAGRYATEDDDTDEWQAFLGMLRKARPKRPLNGVIVAISAHDLTHPDEQAADALAAKIRERLDEIMDRLEIVLPVYVLITKCDLIPGFIETFEELRRAERSQILGFTLPVSRKDELEVTVEHHWTRLVQVVERRAVLRMADARVIEARRRIHEFPQHLEELGPRLVSFIGATFVDNVYREAPLVRGVYLTSGTQEGHPIDRMSGAMAAAFGLPPPTESASHLETKSYFLGELFRSVMFADHDLATLSTTGERRLRRVRGAAAAILYAVGLGVSALAVHSYLLNRDMVRGAQAEVRAAQGYHKQHADQPIALSALEPVRGRLSQLTAWESGRPWSQGFGLYQGTALVTPLRSFYTSTLRTTLMEPLVRTLETDMAQLVREIGALGQVPSVHDHAKLYESLRTYLLLTSPQDTSQPSLGKEQAWVAQRLVTAWSAHQNELPSPAERSAMTAHVDAYLRLLSADPPLGFARKATLVRETRELLARVPLVKLAVDRIVAAVDPHGLDVGADQLIGAAGIPVTATGHVRGAFTRRGWAAHVHPLLESLPEDLLGEGWVLASHKQDENTIAAKRCALRSEYLARYLDEWKAFLGTVRVEEPADPTRALVILQDLTRGQPPPLERIMQTVAHNAQLTEPETPEKEAAQEAAKLAAKTQTGAKAREELDSGPIADLLKASEPCDGDAYVRPVHVRKALEGFFRFGVAGDGSADARAPAQLTAVQIYQEQLTYLRDALQGYHDDPASAEPLLARLTVARTRIRSLIESQEVGWRPRFDALLWPPINGAFASSATALATEKGSQWCTSVVVPFDRTLRGKYPFSRQGQDASLADLADFYRPGSGIIWAFYDSTLKRDVKQVGDRFETSHTGGMGPLYGSELVRFLNRSQHISSVLFPPRAESPRVEFEVRVRPSPGIAQVLFTTDGQTVDFHNGPEQWIRLAWPGAGPTRGAVMRVKGARVDETLTQQGEWGLFRLFDQGVVRSTPGERHFTITWHLHTQNDVVMDVRPARVEHPFLGSKGYLDAFRAADVAAPRSIAAQGRASCTEPGT